MWEYSSLLAVYLEERDEMWRRITEIKELVQFRILVCAECQMNSQGGVINVILILHIIMFVCVSVHGRWSCWAKGYGTTHALYKHVLKPEKVCLSYSQLICPSTIPWVNEYIVWTITLKLINYVVCERSCQCWWFFTVLYILLKWFFNACFYNTVIWREQ